MSDKVTGVKTNGQVTRPTMASGNPGTRRRNQRPRLHSPAGVKARAARRAATAEPRGAREQRFDRGYHVPGSMNPRKVGR